MDAAPARSLHGVADAARDVVGRRRVGLPAHPAGRRPVPVLALGVAVVGGLAFSQVVTLYVTPVFYTYLDDLQSWLGRVSDKLPWSSNDQPPVDRPTLAAGD